MLSAPSATSESSRFCVVRKTGAPASGVWRRLSRDSITKTFWQRDVNLVGGFNPSEKYESMGMIIPSIWENKNVQNHQPEIHGGKHVQRVG